MELIKKEINDIAVLIVTEFVPLAVLILTIGTVLVAIGFE